MAVSDYSTWSNCSCFLFCCTRRLFIMHVPGEEYNQICSLCKGPRECNPGSLIRCSAWSSNQHAEYVKYCLVPLDAKHIFCVLLEAGIQQPVVAAGYRGVLSVKGKKGRIDFIPWNTAEQSAILWPSSQEEQLTDFVESKAALWAINGYLQLSPQGFVLQSQIYPALCASCQSFVFSPPHLSFHSPPLHHISFLYWIPQT